jgi:hypothetical protein
MKHVVSLLGILAVAAMGSAGQFGCAAGTTTVDTGDDGTGTGDDDSGTSSHRDSGSGSGSYDVDSGGGNHDDSGSGGGGFDSGGGGGFDSGGGGGFDSGGGGFDSGGGGGQDSGSTGGSCPGDQSFTTQACQSCMDSMCCNEGVACASDPDCQSLIGCLQQCGTDTNCEDECAEIYSDAVQEYNDLGDCLTNDCDTPCGQ